MDDLLVATQASYRPEVLADSRDPEAMASTSLSFGMDPMVYLVSLTP